MKKSVLLSSLAALVMLIATANAHASTTYKFEVSGVDAYSTTCLNNCSSLALITLSSGKDQGTTTWFVYITIYGQDSQGNQTMIGGVGQVPSSMVSGNGQTSLGLNLDTNAAGLQLQYCVADAFLNYTCNPYAGGVITVTWTPTKTYSESGTTESNSTSATYSSQYHVSGDTSSATVQATYFGQQYTDDGSQIGSDHVGTISVTTP
ncbi:MAG TPA: hypothetical protein VGM18_05710 [Candidatus Sulfotelmatobacter sp.]|jgi:hypothetical protein